MSELVLIAQQLAAATSPEDIFGLLVGEPEDMLQDARKIYHQLAKVTHPDAHQNGARATAEKAFKDLTYWWEIAQRKIANGTYGNGKFAKTDPIRVQTSRREYIVEDQFAQGDICNLYHCRYAVDGKQVSAIFKVARDPGDNDLVSNEARILRRLLIETTDDKYHAYFPQLIESFAFEDSDTHMRRQTNVLSWLNKLYTLKAVRQAYPGGIEAQDMAWMWRRLLVALGYAHKQGVIHGAVLPSHVLIQPEAHGLILIDWSYAVSHGARITAISRDYEQWYPPEVTKRQAPMPGLDIYMAARCMVYLLGGDPITGAVPNSVPKAFQNFFKGCALPGPSMRPQDAWELLEEFDELLERLYGPRRFRPFVMPTNS